MVNPAHPKDETLPCCGVDVLTAIFERRSVRSFLRQPVDEGLVNRLLEAAVQAPSAVNEQPWAFVVVQDAALLRRISELAKRRSLAAMKPGTRLWEHRAMLEDPAYDVFHGAGTLIAICATGRSTQASEDCCLAAQNLLLAAHGLGLATCPIGFARPALDDPAVKAELSIPADHAVVFPIALGYARELPAPPVKRAPRILSWS